MPRPMILGAVTARTARRPDRIMVPVRGRGRPASLLTAESALIGLVVGIAVVGPWTAGGYLILLDWVSGPHQAVTPGLYGLDHNALDAMPYRLATQALRELVGPRNTAWLVILLFFPLAAAGASALAAGGRWRRYTAAVAMVCNPFVVDRIRAGHIPFLLSVALLTWLFASALHARRRGKPFAARPAGWFALAVVVAPHAAWLGGVGLVAMAVLPRLRLVDLLRTVLTVVAAGLVYLYAAVVMASGIPTTRVTAADLSAYATPAGRGGPLLAVVSLHGFWRGGTPYEGLSRPLAAVSLAVLLTAVVTGLALLCRRDIQLGAPLVALVAAGLLLGAGIHGPLGTVYRAAFDVVPLFETMREQQKWVALAVIGYAVAVGGAVEALVYAAHVRIRRARRAAAGIGVLMLCANCLASGPALLWGLGGSLELSRYPQSWYTADRIMGDGPGQILFLPWHGYQPFSFTQDRSVATPAGAFFRREVLSSDSVELGQLRSDSVSRRIAYVDRLVADGGGGTSFGRLVAPLGIEYVVLARDWEAGPYAWLDRQSDLEPVLRTPELDLFRVRPAGTGRVQGARPADYPEALALAGHGELGSEALLAGGSAVGTRHPTVGPRPSAAVTLPSAAVTLPSSAAGGIRPVGSTRWRVEAGAPGWVVIPEEWSPQWRIDGRPGRPTVAGTVAIEVGTRPATVEYVPWRWLRLGLAVSLLAIAGLVAAGLVEHRRALSGWWNRRFHSVPVTWSTAAPPER